MQGSIVLRDKLVTNVEYAQQCVSTWSATKLRDKSEKNVARITGPLIISSCCFAESMQRTANKCVENCNARAQPLFFSLNLLIIDVPVAVAVVVFYDSPPVLHKQVLILNQIWNICSLPEKRFSGS